MTVATRRKTHAPPAQKVPNTIALVRAAAKPSGEQSAFHRAIVMSFEDEATPEAATR